MKFNFDEIVSRRGTGSFKWDEARKDVIPMWVADMDFPVAPSIQRAIQERAQHPIFGYVSVPDAYYERVINWYQQRHGWAIDRESILYTTGVVPAVSAILQSVIQPGEKVIVQTPAYNCFFSSIRNAGAQLAANPLRLVEINDHEFTYELDLEHFEQLCADETTKVFILCNPHNPSGRCWTRNELLAIAEICQRHDVLVISDEIHNELTAPGTSYTPWGTLGASYQENAVVCVSASKSFNSAGLQMANIVVHNPKLRSRINKRININETCDVGPFGYVATMAAFTSDGAEWLDELRQYIWQNYERFCSLLLTNLPKCRIARLEATYLIWVDVSAYTSDSEQLAQQLEREAGLWVNPGEHYGENVGSQQLGAYLRFNVACPRQVMEKGLQRFIDYLQK